MSMRCAVSLVVLLALAMAVGSCGGSGPTQGERSAAVPFILDHNRMIAEVEIGRPDGTRLTVRAWIDTGNQFLLFSEELAVELGVDKSELDRGEWLRPVRVPTPAPPIFLGGTALATEGVEVEVARGSRVWPGVPADLNIPASAFRGLHVVFDYPRQMVTAAKVGERQHRGVPVACRIHPETGLFQIEVRIAGEPVEVGVDTGSAGMWVSKDLTRFLRERNPELRRARGAVGSANFFGFDFELGGTLMRLPEIEIGGSTIGDVAVLGLDQALFDWYSTKSAKPVVGIMGANVLRGLRLEVDFPNQMTYWEGGHPVAPDDLDIVGLTLRPESDGGYTVAGIASRDGAPAVEGIEPGDSLKSIDDLDVHGLSMGPVIEALRGRPGDSRFLVVERDGRRLEIEAGVVRFP